MKTLSILLILLSQISWSQNPVRGVWVASPNHNDLLHSPERMQGKLDQLEAMGINTIYLCVWANEKLGYPSEVAFKYGNYNSLQETSFYNKELYPQISEDPTADLIDAAHQRDMQVIFWFEYGFMAKWGAAPTSDNSRFIANNPQWASQANDGSFSNYNGTDFYYNSFHPKMQEFLLALVKESLEKYPEVDGVQADDRMPAMPINSGYDAYTVARYKASHKGEEPPHDFLDQQWVNWRLELLKGFAVEFHDLVKSYGSDKIVAFSPNAYPWAMENLMQDWPAWAEEGLVDLLSVQLYRKDFESYKKAFDPTYEQVKSKGLEANFSPGVLVGIGGKKMVEGETLDQIMEYHRSQGLSGESFFYEHWMYEEDVKKSIEKHK